MVTNQEAGAGGFSDSSSRVGEKEESRARERTGKKFTGIKGNGSTAKLIFTVYTLSSTVELGLLVVVL